MSSTLTLSRLQRQQVKNSCAKSVSTLLTLFEPLPTSCACWDSKLTMSQCSKVAACVPISLM